MSSASGARRSAAALFPVFRRKVAIVSGSTPIAAQSAQSAPNLKALKNGDYLSEKTRIFHDGADRLPQVSRSGDGRHSFETEAFDGSYVSIVAELDEQSASGIASGMDLVLHLEAASDPAAPAYVRAHFSNEEGREILHDLIVVENSPREVRFNLDGLRIPIDLATTAWVDIVFSDPSRLQLSLGSATLSIQDQ